MAEVKGLCDKRLTKGLIKVDHFPHNRPNVSGIAPQPMTAPQSFIDKHGLWSDEQRRQAEELKLRVQKENLQFVRLAWADPHGASRAKAVTVPAFIAALKPATTSTSRPRRSIPPTPAPSPRSRAAAAWASPR